MNSGREACATYAALEALPEDALALFGAGLFHSAAWYRVVCETALPAGGQARFLVVGTPAQAVFPLLNRPAGALTTPYSCAWAPCIAAGLDARGLHDAGRAFGVWCRRHGTVRLDALDLGDPRWGAILAGVREAGLVALPFDHFGNWYIELAGQDFDAYLAARPGALRATLRRRGAKLLESGAASRIVTGGAGLEAAIAAYEAVYARSWKTAEPYPAFNPALMRACGAAGTLRLALLERAGKPIAAQFWVVEAGTATVLKLAYDEAEKPLSPGTVLTGYAIRHVIENDGVARLDFGRGDDSYKRDWTGTRRQRGGVLIVNPRHPAGLVAIGRHVVRKARCSFLKKRTKKLLPVSAGIAASA
jgi:hypothetical protein